MRVAAIYDVHANLPALEAVLQDIRQAEVDLVVVGGDVLPGPMPRETIACLQALDMPAQFIQGNGDREVLGLMRGVEPGVPEPFREVMRWNARQLLPEHEQLLASWPATLRVQIRGSIEVLFCHATRLAPSMDAFPETGKHAGCTSRFNPAFYRVFRDG
jgi:predicted phosphodiesterase